MAYEITRENQIILSSFPVPGSDSEWLRIKVFARSLANNKNEKFVEIIMAYLTSSWSSPRIG